MTELIVSNLLVVCLVTELIVSNLIVVCLVKLALVVGCVRLFDIILQLSWHSILLEILLNECWLVFFHFVHVVIRLLYYLYNAENVFEMVARNSH